METKNKETSAVSCIRVHRVGTMTAGITMIAFGALFLAHLFLDTLDYQLIFSLWPVILIFLGLELLLSNFLKKQIVYDKAAVFLLVLMTFFTMAMAAVDVCMEAAELYMTQYM